MLPLLLPIGGAGRDATGDPVTRTFQPVTTPAASAVLSVTAPASDPAMATPNGDSSQ